jgi:hypothetical protein
MANHRSVVKEEKKKGPGVKLFDGKPTTRETFYKKSLEKILDCTEDQNSPAFIIAETALQYGGLSTVDGQLANKKLDEAG